MRVDWVAGGGAVAIERIAVSLPSSFSDESVFGCRRYGVCMSMIVHDLIYAALFVSMNRMNDHTRLRMCHVLCEGRWCMGSM